MSIVLSYIYHPLRIFISVALLQNYLPLINVYVSCIVIHLSPFENFMSVTLLQNYLPFTNIYVNCIVIHLSPF